MDLIFGVWLEQLAMQAVAMDFIRELAFTRKDAADCGNEDEQKPPLATTTTARPDGEDYFLARAALPLPSELEPYYPPQMMA